MVGSRACRAAMPNVEPVGSVMPKIDESVQPRQDEQRHNMVSREERMVNNYFVMVASAVLVANANCNLPIIDCWGCAVLGQTGKFGLLLTEQNVYDAITHSHFIAPMLTKLLDFVDDRHGQTASPNNM